MRDIWKSPSFINEMEEIFHFSKMLNIDSFSEDDYLFLLYLIEHWSRLLEFFPESDDSEDEEELSYEKELDENLKEKEDKILLVMYKIREKFKYLNNKYDFQYLENKFFQKYEDISNKKLISDH